MTKDELLKLNGQLEKQVAELSDKDRDIREYISGFLGSYKSTMYSRDEVEVLSWAEIYFRLGKKIGSSDLEKRMDYLDQRISHIEQKSNKNKKLNS